MTAVLDIALTWSARDHSLDLASGTLTGRATLDDATAQAIIDRASRATGATPLRIAVTVVEGTLAAMDDVPAAIRGHFAQRSETAEYLLRRSMMAGWMSLLMGGALLVVLISLVEAIRRFTPDAWRLAIVLQEGLTIVGWVALWRPVEVLLYDRWSLRRDLALLRRLAQVEVCLREPASGNRPRHVDDLRSTLGAE